MLFPRRGGGAGTGAKALVLQSATPRAHSLPSPSKPRTSPFLLGSLVLPEAPQFLQLRLTFPHLLQQRLVLLQQEEESSFRWDSRHHTDPTERARPKRRRHAQSRFRSWPTLAGRAKAARLRSYPTGIPNLGVTELFINRGLFTITKLKHRRPLSALLIFGLKQKNPEICKDTGLFPNPSTYRSLFFWGGCP